MPFRRPLLVPALLAALIALPAAPAVAQETQLQICHYTGSSATPYVQRTLSEAEVEDHFEHDLDLIPAPATGCPSTQVLDPDDEPEPTPQPTEPPTVTICHGAAGGYETLVVPREELDVHADHPRDVIPAPAAGCPKRSRHDGRDRGGRDGGGGGGAGGPGSPQPGSAPALTAAPASVSATGHMPGTLPVTGGRPDVLGLLGLSLVLAGAGMRLRMLSRAS